MTIRSMVAAAVAIAALAAPVRAQQQNLVAEMDEMAKEVAEVLKGSTPPVAAVRVGDFAGPANQRTSGGPVIAKTLGERLPKHGIQIAPNAPVAVTGEYEDVKDGTSNLLAVHITVRVVDANGKTLLQGGRRAEFDRAAFGEALVSSVLGITAKLPPKATPKQRSDILEKKLETPGCHIDGSAVCCDEGGRYAVEIHVAPRPGQKLAPRPARAVNGLAFVPLKRGEVFAVKLVNKSEYDAAATLTLDGLSMYAFSDVKDRTGKPKYSQVILDAGKAAVIKGWHRDNEYSEEFTITEFSKSAAFELKSAAKTGTIQVSFAAAWDKDAGRQPPDEPANPNVFSRGAGADAVGRGQRVGATFKEVKYDVGVVRETVSIRYAK